MERAVSKRVNGFRLDLGAIAASLRSVQRRLPLLNHELKPHRELMDDEVVENLLSAYELVGQLLEARIELFSVGSSFYFLELNNRVLCGTDPERRREFKKHTAATYRNFYERTDAGIQDLMEWYALHRHESVWDRAAGVYIRIVCEPQAFIEGNDRTGTLVMSYLLAKEGYPPFVLSAENAKAYFDLSARVKQLPRNGFSSLFRLPFLKSRIAGFLRNQAEMASLPCGQ